MSVTAVPSWSGVAQKVSREIWVARIGVLLSAFGLFFAAEGLGVKWPGDDAAILYLAVALGASSQLQAHLLARQPQHA